MLSPAMVAVHLVSRGALGAESILLEEPLKLNAKAPPAIANVASIIDTTTDNVFIIIIYFKACWRTLSPYYPSKSPHKSVISKARK